MREITARHRAGNCDEHAFLAQASLRARGFVADLVAFATVDWWARSRRLERSHQIPSLRTVNYEDIYGWSRNWHG